MKKILIIAFIFFFLNSSSFAIEEVVLDVKEDNNNFTDYLSGVYYGNITENVSPVLKVLSQKGITFDNSPINSVKLSLLYENRMNFIKQSHYNPSFNFDFSILEPAINVKFNENKSDAMFDINLLRELPGYSNDFTEKINRFYVGHSINEHQKIYFGQASRLPVSYNGALTTMQQEFILKSQLGRTFGNVMSIGIRNQGTYKYLDYDIGFYDSTRYMKDFGKGTDFSGYVMFKPFENIKEKYGKLNIGGGYNLGENDFSYSQYSLFSGYDYKNIHIKAEYANADGYNAVVPSNNHADGFYSAVSYDVLSNLSFTARYDVLNPNKSFSHDNITEYTLGATYKPYKNMKIMINYIFKDVDNQRNSNMILFATRFFI